MKRVLFADHAPRILGGAEINLVELLAEARTGKNWICACACPPGSPLSEALQPLGVTQYAHGFAAAASELRVVGRRFSLRDSLHGWRALEVAGQELKKIITRFAPEVVISCTNKDHFCAGSACAPSRTPSVWWVNDILSPDFYPKPARLAFRWQARRARRLITVSEFARQALLHEGLPAARVRTIHNGIPLDHYRTTGGRKWRRELGLPAQEPLVGLIGRFTPWKGQEFFLRLAQAWVQKNPHGHFMLVGQAFNEEQGFETSLREFVKAHSLGHRVHWVPFQENIAGVLGELDALVHTSLRPEPFGRVIIEAMAAGVPVIAARAGGVPEILTDGVDGLLAGPGDLASYLGQLERLIHSRPLAEGLAAAARDTVRRRFTVGRVRAEFERVLNELA
jgi:glycosyltransferase involved in cell wall biosynthesis